MCEHPHDGPGSNHRRHGGDGTSRCGRRARNRRGQLPFGDPRIAPAGGGSPALAFDRYSGEFTVESGGRSAVAINTVDVPRAGAYRVRATGARAESEPAIVLGEPSRERVLRLVLGIVVLIIGALSGITALVLAILLRRRPRAA